MSLKFQNFFYGVGLVPNASDVNNKKGQLNTVTGDGKLYYHNGTSSSPVVTESHQATLSNKTLTASVINNATADTITAIAGGNLALNSDLLDNRKVTINGLEFTDTSIFGPTTLTISSGSLSLESQGNVTVKPFTSLPPGTAMEVEFGSSAAVIKRGDLQFGEGTSVLTLGKNPSLTSSYSLYFPATAPTANTALVYNGTDFIWAATGGGSATIIQVIAGETINAGQSVYVSKGTGSDSGRIAGRVYKLNAANDDRIDFLGVAKTTVNSGDNLEVYVIGEIDGLTGLSVGTTVFADPINPGNYSNSAPSAANQWIIPVGVALSATKMAINGAGSATAVKITSEVVDGLYADVQTYNANTTLTNANSIVLVNASGGSRTITLPAPASGKIFNIKKTDSSANAVTISPPSGTIDGAASKSLNVQYESLTITSDGTNFFII